MSYDVDLYLHLPTCSVHECLWVWSVGWMDGWESHEFMSPIPRGIHQQLPVVWIVALQGNYAGMTVPVHMGSGGGNYIS